MPFGEYLLVAVKLVPWPNLGRDTPDGNDIDGGFRVGRTPGGLHFLFAGWLFRGRGRGEKGEKKWEGEEVIS